MSDLILDGGERISIVDGKLMIHDTDIEIPVELAERFRDAVQDRIAGCDVDIAAAQERKDRFIALKAKWDTAITDMI